MSGLLIAAVFAVLYVVFRIRDRRLLRNGFFFVAACFFALVGVFEVLTPFIPGFGILALLLVAAVPLGVLVLAVFLVANGVRMVRREKRTPANLLSLVAGIAIFAVPGIEILLLRTRTWWSFGLLLLIAFVSAYVGAVFLAFLVSAVLYRRTSPRQIPAVLVVLGAQVVHGRVPPLLGSRLERALAVYWQGVDAGRAPLLIPSGGQGSDETGSEGEAMAAYLLERGAAPADVVPETRARNTRENLVFALEIQREVGRPGPVVLVTNNYHAMRTAALAREIGTDAQVIGAPTAAYYVPSAFLREFAAVFVTHGRLHAVASLPFLGIIAVLAVALARQGGF